MASTVMTPIGVLNFPTFYTPRGNRENPNQAERFSGMLLFDKMGVASTAYANLRASVMEALTEKFGAAKAADPAFIRGLRLPFRPAADKTYAGFENGEIYISAWSKGDGPAPSVIDLNAQKIEVPGDVFSGQLARFTVRAFAYENNGNRGASFGLEHVQIVKADMPRLDGRQSAESAFSKAPGDGVDEQMVAMGITASSPASTPHDDDIPF